MTEFPPVALARRYCMSLHTAGQDTTDKPFRLLVCGGRTYADLDRVRREMNRVVGLRRNVIVIHGGARGADSLAGAVAVKAGVPTEVYVAEWEKHGRAAGMLRNKRMLEEGKPDLVLAFPGGIGTGGMIRIARQAGVPVEVIS